MNPACPAQGGARSGSHALPRCAQGHPDSATVAVDVERCAWLAKAGGSTEPARRTQARASPEELCLLPPPPPARPPAACGDAWVRTQAAALETIINGVVCTHPGRVHYVQGLHDVAAVLMLTCGERAACPMLDRLLAGNLRDCVQATLEPVMATLRLLPPLLERADPEMHAFLRRASQEGPALQPSGRQQRGSDRGPPPAFNCHFAVSWLLTW